MGRRGRRAVGEEAGVSGLSSQWLLWQHTSLPLASLEAGCFRTRDLQSSSSWAGPSCLASIRRRRACDVGRRGAVEGALKSNVLALVVGGP